MRKRIAIVGTGPTGIYTFQNLIRQQQPMSVWLFEIGANAGIGMPYSPETASKAILANIASIEIPPIVTTCIDWLEAQPPERLESYGLDPEDLDKRQFTPASCWESTSATNSSGWLIRPAVPALRS